MTKRLTFSQAKAAFGPRVVQKDGAKATPHKSGTTKAEDFVEAFLRSQGWMLIPQPTRLFPLPSFGSYTPDFIAWKPGYAGVMVVEVKGGYRGPGADQGYERYARTAGIYDGDTWHFVMATVDSKRTEVRIDVWGENAEA